MTPDATALPPRRSPWPLILLVMVCGLPPLAGWVLYMNPELLPQRPGNHGVLVDPPRPLPLLTPRSALDNPTTTATGDWLLTVVTEGACGDDCHNQLNDLVQIRRALGASGRRVGSLLLLLPGSDGSSTPLPTGLAPGTRAVPIEPSQAGHIRALFDLSPGETAQRRYLIDPRNQLMMAYDTRVHDNQQILRDLERLLKATRNWNTEDNHGDQ